MKTNHLVGTEPQAPNDAIAELKEENDRFAELIEELGAQFNYLSQVCSDDETPPANNTLHRIWSKCIENSRIARAALRPAGIES